MAIVEAGAAHEIGRSIFCRMRPARSCRDWHQLLVMCALFGTLIDGADGIYDPSLYYDRLLLGLKGTMREAEIHILKAHMLEGRRAKAQRGELVLGLARGYVLKPSGGVALDPDEEVQEIIRPAFTLFERRRSVSGMLRHLVDHDIHLPAISRIFRLRHRLEATGGTRDSVDKPEGMRWVTFDLKMNQVETSRAICNASLVAHQETFKFWLGWR